MGVEAESDPFPARDATSSQIRNFFARFLLTRMVSTIDESHASEIANRWPREATGIQFWTFGLQTYRDVFGKAYGMLLWSHVHSVTEKDKDVISRARKETTAIEKNIIVGLFLLLALFTGWIATYQSSLLTSAALSCAIFSALACWLWLCLDVPSRRAEGNAEHARGVLANRTQRDEPS